MNESPTNQSFKELKYALMFQRLRFGKGSSSVSDSGSRSVGDDGGCIIRHCNFPLESVFLVSFGVFREGPGHV